MFFFFCLISWIFSRIQDIKKPKRTFLKTTVFRNNEANSNLILRHNIQSQNKLPYRNKLGHHDDDDDDDDDDDKDKDKSDLQRFIKFAKSTTGILTLCIAAASLAIIITLVVICCKRCGLCACCNCCACCHCGSKNAPSAAEQYGQVILNNEDDIDYGLESI